MGTTDDAEYVAAMAAAYKAGLMTAEGKATDRCQCPTCLRTFSTEANFDRHLTPGRLADDFDGEWCRDPAIVGLVADERGIWHGAGSVTWAFPGQTANAGAPLRAQVG